ncbi:hypothetical protein HC891_24910, partial [Candidatus Gracilibacteria bacterium]|nr:hypothetical protein [Candidatus Gracilibacteria bacterium]
MPKGPAARLGDSVAHPAPPVLTGVGSPTVFIGKRPAWRGVGGAAVGPLRVANAGLGHSPIKRPSGDT